MSDDDAFDQRLLRRAQTYARTYPSILPRLRAAYEAGHPLVRQVAQAMGVAMDREVGHREDRLREEHGLTPQESKIVLHLIDGGTVQSCAETLDVAESTIRSHLKSVFAKTGVRRQAQLSRLLIQNASD
ncbi:helix-turn-helix transcriptional regulator [Phenylobacterium sp. J367]|uniref:helix-turn-helix transcriptional regulator n=1 Tax=Phenylobacterium sp. J367 TaxID=2898435 RepID=UPI0021508812|nr:helix-turn-helix transcriptional regulator [Phenylobacterium sp. J367]MCR5880291.1 helix-turn-helix transcriptional regulator [Phenylobacterium sp. J367]